MGGIGRITDWTKHGFGRRRLRDLEGRGIGGITDWAQQSFGRGRLRENEGNYAEEARRLYETLASVGIGVAIAMPGKKDIADFGFFS